MKKKTRFVLLGLLQEESLSGYDMKKIIDRTMVFFWSESYGQIYPELASLLAEGLIEVASETKDKSATPKGKLIYSITPQGRLAFVDWLKQENEKETIRNEFLLKLYLSTTENAADMLHHIRVFREESQNQLELFYMFKANLEATIDLHGNHRQILMVLSLGIKTQQLYCDWCDEIEQTITQGGT